MFILGVVGAILIPTHSEVLLGGYGAITTKSTPLSSEASPGQADLGFYDYSCNANTYTPSLTSFSSIWALLNTLVIIIATVIFLMYVCFNKFVNALTS